MIEVKIYSHPDEVMKIVRELRSTGLSQGYDFDFAFFKAKYSEGGWDCLEHQHAVFSFYKEKYATLFTLKYVK